MAHSKQAQKRIRQDANRNAANTDRKSRIRTFIKNLEEAISAGDKKEIPVKFKTAMQEMDKGVQKGVIKRTTASRKLSRLAARIKAMAA